MESRRGGMLWPGCNLGSRRLSLYLLDSLFKNDLRSCADICSERSAEMSPGPRTITNYTVNNEQCAEVEVIA